MPEQWVKAKELLSHLKVPYLPVFGNHDIWSYNSTYEEPYPTGTALSLSLSRVCNLAQHLVARANVIMLSMRARTRQATSSSLPRSKMCWPIRAFRQRATPTTASRHSTPSTASRPGFRCVPILLFGAHSAIVSSSSHFPCAELGAPVRQLRLLWPRLDQQVRTNIKRLVQSRRG
jgi:hypothetical protein